MIGDCRYEAMSPLNLMQSIMWRGLNKGWFVKVLSASPRDCSRRRVVLQKAVSLNSAMVSILLLIA